MAIKSELALGFDNFNNQKTLNEVDTISQLIVNILMLRQGQIPGLPHLGMNIKQYLYKTEDEINTDIIKNQLRQQCSTLTPYIDMDNIQVVIFPYKNESILYISIPFSFLVESGDNKSLIIGYKKQDNSSDITFNYKVTNTV